MKVYFISGLAADSRVFKNIVLPEGFEMVHLDWIAPFQNESLGSYSARLAAKITPGEKFALIGVSMGGMIASEIAKQFSVAGKLQPAITILLSSVPIHKHLPVHLKIAGFLKLYKLMPTGVLKSATVLKRFFTSNTKEDKAIVSHLVK